MPIEIIVPRLGWSMEEGVFVDWLKQDGDFVHAGEPLFRIEGDKAIQEVESIDSGILRISREGPKPGAPVRVGQLLGHLCAVEESPSAAVRAAISPDAGKSSEKETIPAAIRDSAVAESRPQVAGTPRRTLAISPRALRLATALHVDWTQISGTGRTGRIREKDIRDAAQGVPASAGEVRESSEASAVRASQSARPPPPEGGRMEFRL